MRTIKLIISYDGTAYCGWQRQKNGVSVQDMLEKAVATMTHEKVCVHGASRTDAGVHAFAQVAHFSTEASIPCDGFVRGLNSILPDDIRVCAAIDERDGFHARKGAKGKNYRYVIHLGTVPSAVYARRAWHIREKLDVAAMRKAARYLEGKHDFKAFQASGSSVRSSVRTIRKVRVARHRGGKAEALLLPCGLGGIAIDIEGDGFLRHMVRNIVGTLVAVGQGKFDSDDMKEILDGKNRKAAGICAPPHGLYLISVSY